jgi:hypothetical protein
MSDHEERNELRGVLAEWHATQAGGDPLDDEQLERRLRAIDGRLRHAERRAITSSSGSQLVVALEAERDRLIADVEAHRLAWVRGEDAMRVIVAALIDGAPEARRQAVAEAQAERDQAAQALEQAGAVAWQARARLQARLIDAEERLRAAFAAACEDDSG